MDGQGVHVLDRCPGDLRPCDLEKSSLTSLHTGTNDQVFLLELAPLSRIAQEPEVSPWQQVSFPISKASAEPSLSMTAKHAKSRVVEAMQLFSPSEVSLSAISISQQHVAAAMGSFM